MTGIGGYKHLLQLLKRTQERDGLGQRRTGEAAWLVVDEEVWANIRYATGIATLKADALTTITRVSIRIRYRTDVVEGMRLQYGSTLFEIKAVLPDEERHRHLDLPCEVVR